MLLKFVTLTALLLCMALAGLHATAWYVKTAATGANDGTSWTNAFTTLNDALFQSKAGDTIKIAEGVYIPTTTDNPDVPFYIKGGVVVLGGYPAIGNPSDNDRDWVNHFTVLSGQLQDGYSSNTIVSISGTKDVVIDGFTIRHTTTANEIGAL